MHNEPHSELEREALAAWSAQEPPPGFADRVLAADAGPKREPILATPELLPRLGRRWSGVAAAALIAAALAGSIAAATKWWPTATPPQQQRLIWPEDREHEVDPAIGAALPEPAKDTPKPAPGLADITGKVDAYLGGFGRRYGEAFKFHGSVAVVRDGELVYARGLGVTDLKSSAPVSADTRFKVGSLSQQLTAIAILQLRDAGKLGLDDPLRKHLRDYPRVGDGITLRHLLSHTSGIPNYTEDLPRAGIEPGQQYTARRIRDSFENLPLEFRPGTDFDPSNAGYFLLGLVVEQVSGRRLAEVIRTGITEPAGMHHTTVDGTSSLNGSPMATGHEFSEDEILVPVTAFDLSVYRGAASVISTANDLVRLDHALRVPGLLLSATSLAEMYTPVRNSYGLGWVVQQDHGRTMVGHPGGVDGFNAAWLRYLDGGKVTVIALANTEAVDCRQVAHDVAAIALGEAVEPPVEYIEQPVPAAMFERYLGDYSLSDRSRAQLAGVVDGGGLDLLEGVRVYEDVGRMFMLVPLHGAKWLHASGPDEFFFKDPAGTLARFGPPGTPVETLTLRQGDLEFTLVRGKPPATRVLPVVDVGPAVQNE